MFEMAWYFSATYNADAHKHACTLTPMNARTPYPYEHLRETTSKKLYSTGLEINEVNTCASLLTGTSLPTEEYSAFNETPKCQT
jgi:hypothetical protein